MTKVPEPGETLSHERLTDPIGSGSMGVVCRALDTRLVFLRGDPRFTRILDGMK
jgi:hypothetical protein